MLYAWLQYIVRILLSTSYSLPRFQKPLHGPKNQSAQFIALFFSVLIYMGIGYVLLLRLVQPYWLSIQTLFYLIIYFFWLLIFIFEYFFNTLVKLWKKVVGQKWGFIVTIFNLYYLCNIEGVWKYISFHTLIYNLF